MILENELLQLALGMAQAVLLLLCAPLVTGIVKKVKAWMQNRIGSSIWQEYYDIRNGGASQLCLLLIPASPSVWHPAYIF